MLAQRLITGPLLIGLLLGCLWLDSLAGGSATVPAGVVLLLLAAAAAGLGARELASIAQASGLRSSAWIITLGAWGLLAWTWYEPAADPDWAPGVAAVVLVATWIGAVLLHARTRRTDGVLGAAGVDLFSVVYLGGMLSFYLLIRQDWSPWWVAAIVLIIKSCDIGAYFTGMAVGRHTLIPWLSPGKTVEGLIGGIVTAVGAALLALWILGPEGHEGMTWITAVVLGSVLGLAGQAGDLAMSLLKRGAGIKDSSTALPGMGGVMDVLDSPLLGAPVAWVVLTAMS